jgi:hypothetical protein
MNRNQITLQFNDLYGVQHLDDINELPIPPEISQATKDTIITELNMKMDEYRISKACCITIPLGMACFFISYFINYYAYPFNIILYMVGFGLIFSYPVYLGCKRRKQRTMIKYVVDLVHCRTFGVLRLECIYGLQRYNTGRPRRGLQQFVVRVMHAKLNQYNVNQMNNPFNRNFGQRNGFMGQNNGVLGQVQEPLIPHYPQQEFQNNQQNGYHGNNAPYVNRNNPPQYPY